MESKEWSRFIFLLSMLFSRGFSINICTDIVVRSSSGYITTPNFPNTYLANISCALTIRRPFGERINFKFIYMNLETKRNGSCSDSLKISGITTKTFCGNDNMTFVPGGSVVSVSFSSDSKVGYNGFNITFTSFSESCNFDGGLQTSVCPWSNVNLEDDFNWSINSGTTSTSDTGPSHDITGSTSGKYLYTEASPQLIGDKAWLVGNNLTSSFTCFSFAYHMYGAGMGTLNIYLEYKVKKSLLWSMIGNQGNQWWYSQFTANFTSFPSRLIIEGVRGSSFTSDIAIDNLALTPGYCETVHTHVTFNEINFKGCNFEKGFGTVDCPWNNTQRSDNFDWAVISGNVRWTTSLPYWNSKRSSEGKYMYLKGRNGKKARLVSQYFKGSTKCLLFSYYINSAYSYWSSLYVYQETVNGAKRQLFVISGNSGYHNGYNWRQARILISNANTIQKIIIEGITGYSSSETIAVDELRFIDCQASSTTPQYYSLDTTTRNLQQTTQKPSSTTRNPFITIPISSLSTGTSSPISRNPRQTTQMPWNTTLKTLQIFPESIKSSSNENAGVIIASVALALLIIMSGIFIIWYIRHNNKKKTSSTTSSDSYQNPAYSDGEQKKTTVLPPPPNVKSESKSPPVDSNAPFAMAKCGVLYFVPADNQSNVVPSNPPHNNTNAGQMSFISTSTSENPYYIPSSSLHQDVQSQYHY